MALLNPELPANNEHDKLSGENWTDWTHGGQEIDRELQRMEMHSPASNKTYDTLQQPDVQVAPLDNNITIMVSSTRSPNVGNDSFINDETVYIGESNLLTLVASNDSHVSTPAKASSDPRPRNVTYQLSNDTDGTTAGRRRTSACTSNAFDFLNREGAFEFPHDQVTKVLLKAYFDWFHPCFPVVEASTISQEYQTKKLSPMLLQAMLFIGTCYLSDKSFPSTDFASRQDTKFHFYHRAKSLYDASWEINSTVIIQTLFLLSFWRSNARDDKDTRHWLVSAISFAQSQGYHRSLCWSSSNAARDRSVLSLRRRIWWSLYVSKKGSSDYVSLNATDS